MDWLENVFGAESTGATPEERARTSNKRFVRSQDQLGCYSEKATGRQLSAWEAWKAFGPDILQEALEYGAAPLPRQPSEPSATLVRRREELGLSHSDLAKGTHLKEEQVRDAENPERRTPIRALERIAQALALDESRLTVRPDAGADAQLAVRMRQIGSQEPNFDASFVLQMSEAAWVIKKQQELEEWLQLSSEAAARQKAFRPSPDYSYPVWEHAQWLASQTRYLLSLPSEEPIDSLRALVSEKLGIPLVQMRLPTKYAGATILNEGVRGVAVNMDGRNGNVWVRRATIAHELGHLLWDPDDFLTRLVADTYDELERNPYMVDNYADKWHSGQVEARANAFAIEVLAPQRAAIDTYEARGGHSQGLRAVMERFGVSFTAARYQVWNGSDRTIPFDSLWVETTEPTEDWQGRESFTIDYLPGLPPQCVPASRRGRFAEVVFRAQQANLLSQDSAAALLLCDREEYEAAVPRLQEFFDGGGASS